MIFFKTFYHNYIFLCYSKILYLKNNIFLSTDIKRILKMKLNLLEHLDWHDVAFVNEQKNHLLTNLDHLLDVPRKLDTPKLYIINYLSVFTL